MSGPYANDRGEAMQDIDGAGPPRDLEALHHAIDGAARARNDDVVFVEERRRTGVGSWVVEVSLRFPAARPAAPGRTGRARRSTLRPAAERFDRMELAGNAKRIAAGVLREVRSRLKFLLDVGLDYLTLEPRGRR